MKLPTPTAAHVIEVGLTLIVLAASLATGVWTLATVIGTTGPAGAAMIAIAAAIGVEAALSTIADDLTKTIVRTMHKRAVTR